MKDFIISYVSYLSVKRPSCWTKTQQKPPERCNVRSLTSVMNNAILGDPGAVSGGGKKSKRARKNSGEEKSRRRRRAPGDKVLKDQFQTVRLVLASDWCQKTFVLFCPIAEQQDQESFRVLLHDRYIQASCSPCYSRRKVSITAQNVGEIVRHIRKKLATNTLDLSQVS